MAAVHLLVLLAFSAGGALAVPATLNLTVPARLPAWASPRWLKDGKINICTSPWTPMVDCNVSADAIPVGEVGGYLTEVSDLAFQRVGWTKDDYVYTCMNWDAMMEDLIDVNGTCYMSTAGAKLSTQAAMDGIQFSWVMDRTYLSILIYAPTKAHSIWGFLSPFRWDLWLALVLTAFGLAFLVIFLEWASSRRGGGGKTSDFAAFNVTNVGFSMWQTFGFLVAVVKTLGQVKSLATRVVVWTYGLMILITIATYTGQLAATFTVLSIDSSIKGMADLRGKTVGTWEGYEDRFTGVGSGRYPVHPIFLPWENDDDERGMLQYLWSGRVDALLIDTAFAKFVAARDCDLVIVGETFEPMDMAMAFPPSFDDDATIQAFSVALKANQEKGLVDPIQARYFEATNMTNCSQSPGPIAFHAMMGLWYMLGISVIVALVIVAALHLSWATGTSARIQKKLKGISSKASQRLWARKPRSVSKSNSNSNSKSLSFVTSAQKRAGKGSSTDSPGTLAVIPTATSLARDNEPCKEGLADDNPRELLLDVRDLQIEPVNGQSLEGSEGRASLRDSNAPTARSSSDQDDSTGFAHTRRPDISDISNAVSNGLFTFKLVINTKDSGEGNVLTLRDVHRHSGRTLAREPPTSAQPISTP